ncbi:MAG: potassium-transporting ATPase subunit KdpA [Thermoanaerobaculaceae bacterium]|nr:potassium-transporting ATPase subunit KdpA [Thermoanaerobaculaceae bacterium]
MTAWSLAQITLALGVLLLAAVPLGRHMARVYEGQPTLLGRPLRPLERWLYRWSGVDPEKEMEWKAYALAMLAFHLVGFGAVYLLQRFQGVLPLNPDGLGAVEPTSAFNTAVSFVTNTNWQGYGGETTMSHLTQMLALTVQSFVSAGSGMALLVALIRGLTRRSTREIGNFWVDMTRSTLYVLLPLSLVLALALVSQGVVQTFRGHATATLVEAAQGSDGSPATEQRIAVGPVASQIAIKQLGTNGGGFFNANSAHPFENPTPLSNLLETLSILLIPAALCLTFGIMVRDRRQGWALLAAMLVVLVPAILLTTAFEQGGNPALTAAGADQHASAHQPGGNMEGKEARFGIASSTTWAAFTTAASNGSVNSMHDSYTPLGGLVPLVLMQLGEVIFGGVGSGLYGMLVLVIIAVFAAGLMVGRTPEYLGKKIEPFEMKMAAIAILAMPLAVLVGAAIAVALPAGTATIANPGPHGFSEVLYAFSSAGNNNGSAFAGLGANTPFYNVMLGLAMLVGRFVIKVPVIALAGSLAAKKIAASGAGTLPTHTPMFVGWLLAVVIIVGGLTFFPALALGPIVEHLMLH